MYEDALARVDLFSGLRKKELQEVATYLREGTHSLAPRGQPQKMSAEARFLA